MGVIVTKDNETNSKLNRRISADLRSRATSSLMADDPDGVEDSDYVKDLKKTGKHSWVWAVLIGLAAISMIVIVTL